MAVFHLVGLVRNSKTGLWEYRREIPEHLRPQHDRKTFKRATGTAEKRLAERKAAPLIAEYAALIAALEERHREALAAAHHSTPGRGPLPSLELAPEDLARIAGDLAQALLKKHAANPAPSEAFKSNGAVIAPEDGVPPPAWGTRDQPWAFHRMMLLAPKASARPATDLLAVTEPLRDLLRARGLAVAGDQWAALCDLARGSLDAAYSILQQRAKGSETWTEERLVERFGLTPGSPAAPRVGFDELLEGVERERNLRPDTIRQYRSHVKELTDFLKHDDASRLTPDDVVRWKDRLVASGKLDGVTINDGRLASVRSVLGWGKDNKKIATNPALGVRVKAKKKPRTRSKDLSDAEASMILRASLGVGTLEEQLADRHKAARRWIPWLCCYSGARVTEIAQLRGEDIQQEAGVRFMLLTPDAGAIKSDQFRRVPLHAHIIGQGFLEFVEKAGNGPLFYDPKLARKANPNKPYAETVGAKLGAWVRKIGVTDLEVAPNHGWRHRFITACRNAEVDPEARSFITGHAPQTVGEAYGGSHGLVRLAAQLAKLPAERVEMIPEVAT